MIETYDPSSSFIREVLQGLQAMDVRSSVQITIALTENGLYDIELGRATTSPRKVEGLHLGTINDVPPGQRRATWLLTDAVQLALSNPEAHHLLHW